jgi:cytochrome c oxidase cbb3-type subunit I/II
MYDPRMTSPGSIMPSYKWMFTDNLSTKYTKRKIKAMITLGVPYTDYEYKNSVENLNIQAEGIAKKLNEELQNPIIQIDKDKEIIALIAYLQRLGTDIKTK